MQSETEPIVLAYAGRSYVGFSIEADGKFGREKFHFDNGPLLLSEYIHCGRYSAKTLTLLTSRRILLFGEKVTKDSYVVFDRPDAAMPAQLEIERCMSVGSTTYVIWSGSVTSAAESDVLMGVGYLDQNDQVHAIGAPFYRGNRLSGMAGLRLPGAYDAETREFHIDLLDEQAVLRLAVDGTVLAREQVSSTVPYLLHWAKMEDGRWTGLHGGRWVWFTLQERPLTGTIGDALSVSTTLQSVQFRDSRGTLWLVAGANYQLVTRRWDKESSRLGEAVITPATVETCDILLSH